MRLIPRKVAFFDLLELQAATGLEGAKLLQECLVAFGSPEAVYLASKKIHDVEHTGDDLAHKVVDLLNKTFITPLDREDIHQLTVKLDDVLDHVDRVAKRLVVYKIEQPTAHCIELSRILVRQSEEIVQGVHALRELKTPDAILKQCSRIGQLENDADQVMSDALSILFSDRGRNPIDVIKWKDLYENLEEGTDKAKEVANILETVLVKYS